MIANETTLNQTQNDTEINNYRSTYHIVSYKRLLND